MIPHVERASIPLDRDAGCSEARSDPNCQGSGTLPSICWDGPDQRPNCYRDGPEQRPNSYGDGPDQRPDCYRDGPD
jgi:hypothetical protein